MAIRKLHISGYRSIRDMHLELKQINVFLGDNGTGKSNLYRSLYLLHAAALGRLPHVLAEEGGLPSALWSGRRMRKEKGLKIRVDFDELTYKLAVGHVPKHDRPDQSRYDDYPYMEFFRNDPDVKSEHVSTDYRGKQIDVLTRKRNLITARNMDGRPIEFPLVVSSCESVLSGLREPHMFPDLSILRQEILSWRFYHHFRTDSHSPLRGLHTPVFTPILSHDARDLPSALATICGIDGQGYMAKCIDEAFPGATLQFIAEEKSLQVALKMPDFHRPFLTRELSDGTLQYLCLLAALLSPRPPLLMALNEPETSMHVSLMEPLAKLICDTAKKTQMWVTTHSPELAKAIKDISGVPPIKLHKVDGETRVVGAKLVDDEDDEDYEDFEEDL